MKNNILLCALLLLCSGCASEPGETSLPYGGDGTVSLHLAGALPEAASGLETPLYIFRRPAGTDGEYIFERAIATAADGGTLDLPAAELTGGDYRFLMVAQPAEGERLSLQTAEGAPFVPGDAWSGVRLASPDGRAGLDGYCGVTDMEGRQILDEGKVGLTLTRIAGQMLFDFFRIGGSMSEPESVASADVSSVADRVAKIEITYENPTVSLRFDDANRLVPAGYATKPLTQVFVPEMSGFKVALPQPALGLEACHDTLRGSLRIRGACLLPSDGKVRARLSFTYYDTTPSCANAHDGGHSDDCYPLRQVSLDLPAASAADGLTVASDCYTVNRAGLRCDRIIDIPAGGGIEADFDWF